MNVFELGKLDKRLGLPFRKEYETWNRILQIKYEDGRFAQLNETPDVEIVANTSEYEMQMLLEKDDKIGLKILFRNY